MFGNIQAFRYFESLEHRKPIIGPEGPIAFFFRGDRENIKLPREYTQEIDTRCARTECNLFGFYSRNRLSFVSSRLKIFQQHVENFQYVIFYQVCTLHDNAISFDDNNITNNRNVNYSQSTKCAYFLQTFQRYMYKLYKLNINFIKGYCY